MLMTQKVLNNKSNISELKRDFDSVDIGVDHNTGLNQRELDTQYQTSHLTKFNNISRTNLFHTGARTAIFSDKLQMKCLGDR